MQRPDLWERIRSRCIEDPETGCLTWTGARDGSGKAKYGRVNVGGKMQLTHRVAYISVKGEIPIGLELDHLCFNTLCANPDHLEAVTRLENIRRSRRVNTDRCMRGHLLDGVRANGTDRYCKTCSLIRYRKWHERQKSA